MTEELHEGVRPRQLKDGRAFVLDAPVDVPAIWGRDDTVAWAAGEPLMIVGQQGIGKTAVLQQLANARLGIGDGLFLGLPVKASDKPVLYLALDRPRQIARSWRRMVTEEDADVLRERLIVWEGALPYEVKDNPLGILHMCEEYGAGTVFLDSYKDATSPLTDDAVGAAVNRAQGACVAAGIEWAGSHHNRKATTDNRKPTTLADVYGSVWLTAGAGSVISLAGDPGDPIVELTHLKQPAAEIGPLELEHDHKLGRTTVRATPTVETLLREAGSTGVIATEVANVIHGSKSTRAKVEKVRRELQRLVATDQATEEKGALAKDAVRYRVIQRDRSRDASRHLHAASRTPENTNHNSYTPPESGTSLLRERVPREAKREAEPPHETFGEQHIERATA